MDPELKKHIKWFFTKPMMLWLPTGFLLLIIQNLFEEHEYYDVIAFVCSSIYIFCIIMFMRGLKATTTEAMKRIESKSVEYITSTINRGAGRAKYIVPVSDVEGFWRRKRMQMLGTTYIRPYSSSYMDTGMEYMKAHIEIPVSKKQAFQLKLMGCYDTDDRERAKKALDFLNVDWPLP